MSAVAEERELPFLSTLDMEYMSQQRSQSFPEANAKRDKEGDPADGDGSSLCSELTSGTYFPLMSDVHPPELELGWPGMPILTVSGQTQATIIFQRNKVNSIKDLLRSLISQAQTVCTAQCGRTGVSCPGTNPSIWSYSCTPPAPSCCCSLDAWRGAAALSLSDLRLFPLLSFPVISFPLGFHVIQAVCFKAFSLCLWLCRARYRSPQQAAGLLCSVAAQLFSARSCASSVPHQAASGQGCLGLWTPREVGQENSTGGLLQENAGPEQTSGMRSPAYGLG